MRIDQAMTRLRDFILSEALFVPSDRLLVAVSGGKDSMCLLRLVRELPNTCAVAHVNYMLRGEASDADAKFVRAFSRDHHITFFEKTIDLEEEIESTSLGIQEAAREVRYTWLQSVCAEKGYDIILTGHHADDALESLFINLMRGTGIRGLTGIPAKRNSIVRPLLCFRRAELDELVRNESITYRDDLSNQSDAYLRNRIRHHLIPVLDALKPGSDDRILKNMHRLRTESALLDSSIARYLIDIVQPRDGQIALDLPRLQDIDGGTAVLFAVAQKYGFAWEQCRDLLEMTHQAGTHYLSDTHEMIVDREEILIIPKIPADETVHFIEAGETLTFPDGSLSILETELPDTLQTPGGVEYIDPAKSGMAFEVRRWREGDRFQPLGMEGTQKLQDFFSNIKLSVADKRDVWILTAGEKIVWVVGHRLDERFKIDAASRSALRLEWST